MHVCTHTHRYTHTQPQTHTQRRVRIYTQAHTQAHTHSHTHRCTHTGTRTLTHMRAHTCTHTCTHMRSALVPTQELSVPWSEASSLPVRGSGMTLLLQPHHSFLPDLGHLHQQSHPLQFLPSSTDKTMTVRKPSRDTSLQPITPSCCAPHPFLGQHDAIRHSAEDTSAQHMNS